MEKNKEEILSFKEIKTTKFTLSSPQIKLEGFTLVSLWDRLPVLSSRNSSVYRLDPAGAILKLSDYNKETPHGWVAQPMNIFETPLELNVNNLVGIHWMNAVSRLKTSKKDSGSFVSVVTRIPNPLLDYNIKKDITVQNKSLFRTNSTPIVTPAKRTTKK